MKILARVGDKYIAEISHAEVEKVLGRYYGNLQKLEPGEEMNLSTGYDYTYDIQKACTAIIDANKAFEGAQETLYKFAQAVVNQNDYTKKPDKK